MCYLSTIVMTTKYTFFFYLLHVQSNDFMIGLQFVLFNDEKLPVLKSTST